MDEGYDDRSRSGKAKESATWGVVASRWVGNLMLVVITLPLIGVWVKLLTVSYRLLYPAILLFCCVGVYSIKYCIFDVVLAAVGDRRAAHHDDRALVQADA